MSESLPCPSWVFSNNSNTHVAKDRSWFADDYIPFDGQLGSMYGGKALSIIGVGTVELPVRILPDGNGPDAHGTLKLHNVVHVPNVLCNIVGMPAGFNYAMSFGGDPRTQGCILQPETGKPVALFSPGGEASEIWLSEPPIGPRVGSPPWEPDAMYLINATLPPNEKKSLQQILAREEARPQRESDSRPLRLSDAEKAWMKKHYGGEFKFLQMHGLTIHNEDDRREGQRIVRALMENDG